MQDRVAECVRDLSGLGLDAGSESRPRTLNWVRDQLVAAELTAGQDIGAGRGCIEAFMPRAGRLQKLCGRGVVLSADLWGDRDGAGRHRHAAGAGALIESVRVMRATQKGGHFGELGFDVLVRLGSFVEGPASRGESSPAAEGVLGEIRFGDLPVASRDLLRIAVTADAGQAALIEDLRRLFARFQGQQGFWKEIVLVADETGRRADGAPRFTLSSPSDAGGGPESRPGADRSAGEPARRSRAARRRARRPCRFGDPRASGRTTPGPMNDWRNDDQLLCHCHGVKAGVVRRVIREIKPRDAREVGRVCKAGTGCRSCVPDIETVMGQERSARGSVLARFFGGLFGRKGSA